MAITHSQYAGNAGALFGNTTTYDLTTLGSAPTAGQVFLVAVRNGNNRSVSSVTLSSSGTQTSAAFLAANGRRELWWGVATGSETNSTIRVVLSGNADDFEAVACHVFSGVSSDQSGAPTPLTADTTGVTTHGIGPITPAVADSVVLFFAERTNATWTEDATFTATQIGGFAFFPFDYLIVSSTSGVSHSMTSDINRDSNQILAAFSGSGGGGGEPDLNVSLSDPVIGSSVF